MLSNIWFERSIYFDEWTRTFLCVEWLMIELLRHRFLKLCMKNLIIKKRRELIRKSRQDISDSKSCEMSRIIWKSVIHVNEKLLRKRKKFYISSELTFCDRKYASILFICNHLKKNIIWYSFERIFRNELKTKFSRRQISNL